MRILSTMQAIQISIESIKQRNDLSPEICQEAIEIMERLSCRDWYIKWDRESIIKALKDFKERTGKAPTVTNLTETGMPKSITIQSHFHINASLLLKQLFPENRKTKSELANCINIYGFETEDEWLNCFKEQFKKHISEGMCCKKYDLLRDDGTPTWNTIARHCGSVSWSELMEKAGVEYISQTPKTATGIHISNTTSPTIKKLEEINKQRKILNSELYNILVDKK